MEHGNAGLAALSSLDDPVRRRLYDFVAGRHEPAGRDEAATAAGIGRPLAAYHLDKLVNLGLLTASYQRPPGRGGPGAGRPAKVYARSAAEFAVTLPPREYELAARLLAGAVAADEAGGCHDALRDAARRHGQALGAAARTGGGSPGALLAVLREHGFEPDAPASGAAGPVRLRNCPFRVLAGEHTKLVCGMNLALIGGVIDGLGAAGPRADLAPEPGCCCVIISGLTSGVASGPGA